MDILDYLIDKDDPTAMIDLDDGKQLECHVLKIFDVDDKEYIALFPVGGGETDDIIFYRYERINEEEFNPVYIEDDDEFERVCDAFDMFLDDVEYEDSYGDLDD